MCSTPPTSRAVLGAILHGKVGVGRQGSSSPTRTVSQVGTLRRKRDNGLKLVTAFLEVRTGLKMSRSFRLSISVNGGPIHLGVQSKNLEIIFASSFPHLEIQTLGNSYIFCPQNASGVCTSHISVAIRLDQGTSFL